MLPAAKGLYLVEKAEMLLCNKWMKQARYQPDRNVIFGSGLGHDRIDTIGTLGKSARALPHGSTQAAALRRPGVTEAGAVHESTSVDARIRQGR
jgi:hypothetical protein